MNRILLQNPRHSLCFRLQSDQHERCYLHPLIQSFYSPLQAIYPKHLHFRSIDLFSSLYLSELNFWVILFSLVYSCLPKQQCWRSYSLVFLSHHKLLPFHYFPLPGVSPSKLLHRSQSLYFLRPPPIEN